VGANRGWLRGCGSRPHFAETQGFNVAGIAAKRRHKSNPWFKRGTLFRSAVNVVQRAQAPMTAREITDALIADKAVPATRKQFIDLQAAVLAGLRKAYDETSEPEVKTGHCTLLRR
jgi:hypothetical protein